jgi:hypothetical protein
MNSVEITERKSQYLNMDYLTIKKGKKLGNITSILAKEQIPHFIPTLQPHKSYIRSWTIQVPTVEFSGIPGLLEQPDLRQGDRIFYYAHYHPREEKQLQKHPNWERFKRKDGLLLERIKITSGYEKLFTEGGSQI